MKNRTRAASLILIGLSSAVGAQGFENRSVECVEFLPGSQPGLVTLRATIGVASSSEGVDKDLSFVADVFLGGALIASTNGDVSFSYDTACPASAPCNGGCEFVYGLNPQPGFCSEAPGLTGCFCGGKIPIDWNDILGVADTGETITVQVRPAVGAMIENETGDDSAGVVFDGYYQCSSLSADVVDVSLASGGSQSLAIDAGAENAGSLYVLLGSLTGTEPGLPLAPGVVLPLNYDAYTLFPVSQAGTPIFTGTIGVLDGNGYATCGVHIPAGLEAGTFAGLTLHHAGLVYGATGLPSFATSAARLEFTP